MEGNVVSLRWPRNSFKRERYLREILDKKERRDLWKS